MQSLLRSVAGRLCQPETIISRTLPHSLMGIHGQSEFEQAISGHPMTSWLLPFQVDGKHLAMGVVCCHKGRESVNLDFVSLMNSVSTMHCAQKC